MKMKKGWIWVGAVVGVLVFSTIVVMVAQNFGNFIPVPTASRTEEKAYDRGEAAPPADGYAYGGAEHESVKMTRPADLDQVASSTPGVAPTPLKDKDMATTKVDFKKTDNSAFKQMLNKNGSITIESDDPMKASLSCTEVAVRFGGDILNSNTSYSGQNAYVSMTIRIPSQSFEKAMNELQKVGKATSINTTAEDVTSEYVDLQTRQATIEKLVKKLNGLLDNARNEEAMVEMYEKIAQYEQELESIKGQMKYLEGMTSFSRITISISKPGETISYPSDNEFVDGLKFLLRAFLTAVMWILVIIAVAIPIVLLVLLIVWLVRLFTRKPQQQ